MPCVNVPTFVISHSQLDGSKKNIPRLSAAWYWEFDAKSLSTIPNFETKSLMVLMPPHPPSMPFKGMPPPFEAWMRKVMAPYCCVFCPSRAIGNMISGLVLLSAQNRCA